MSLNNNDKRRLLESIEYIDDALISDTMSRVKTDGVTASAQVTKKRVVWVKQVAALAACALLLGAIIPVVSLVSRNMRPSDGIGAGEGIGDEQTEPEVEATEIIEETEAPNVYGSEGIRYMINEDGVTASMIGWGECKDETAYVASVYEGLPVTKMIFIEQLEDQEKPDDGRESVVPDDFSFPNIKHVVIPNSVEYVKAGVINQCDYMESLHIGAGVTEIDGPIFFNGERGRNFSKITVDPENKYYTEKGNCLIRIADKFLMCAFADSVIPDDGSVEVIGSVAFFNKPGLTSVVIPEGVVKITSGAFKNNYELVSVSIPTTIKKMYGSFGFDSVTEFKYAGTVEQWKQLENSNPRWTTETSLTQVTCSDGVVELEFIHGRISPDEELVRMLLSMSEEKRKVFIDILSEDERARVTELLSRVDDENLNE